MDRIDRLLIKALPKPTKIDKLKADNPYYGKSLDELLDCMSPRPFFGIRAPENGTPEHDKFVFALMEAAGRE